MWHEKTSKTHCGQSKSRGNLNVSQCFSIYIPTIHKANYTINNIHLKGIKKKDLEGVMHEWLPLTKGAGVGLTWRPGDSVDGEVVLVLSILPESLIP